MKFFRIHIARQILSTLLLVGTLFYFLKPVQAKANNDAFAHWLLSHLKADSDTLISNRILEITLEQKNLDKAILEASALVSAFSDSFEFPINGKTDSSNKDVLKVLITEWDNFRNGSNSMANAVITESLKASIQQKSDLKNQFSSLIPQKSSSSLSNDKSAYLLIAGFEIPRNIEFSTSISINAP